MVSTGLIISYGVEAVLVTLLPIILLIVWKKKTNASLKPVITGAIIFPVFAMGLKLIPAYFLLIADNPVSKAINSNAWLYAIIGGGLLAGIFEEGGRFVAFKFILKNNTENEDAISYGIGHSGFECIYAAGGTVISCIAIAIMVNSGNTEPLFAGLDEAKTETMNTFIQSLIDTPAYLPCTLGVLERISAMTVHIANSVLVFTAVNRKGYGYLFPTAIILHTVANSMTGFVNTGTLTILQVEIIIFVYALIIGFFAYRIYRKTSE